MARISLTEDQKLATKNLLRPSVVARLLGVAPKTIHAWKDIPFKKIHGVKYMHWHDICAKHKDAIETLALPQNGNDAYVLWKGVSIHEAIAGKGNMFSPISKAQAAINKAKLLLTPKEINEPVQETLKDETPIIEEEILTIAPEYEHLIKKTEVITVVDKCPECPHSIGKFHTIFGCKFAKGTAAECLCKRGK